MYILFDIGGTKTRIAGSRNGKVFTDPVIFKTPKKFQDGIRLFSDTAKKIAGKEKIVAAGGGFAGPLNAAKTSTINSPHLAGWVGKPLTNTLSRVMHAPVYIDNDTAIVGLGEAVAGAGQGYDIVAYLTISTGVNGARIVNKHIDANAFGFEIGHQFIAPPDYHATHSCVSCPISGHLEGFISGSALEKKYHKKPHDITDKKIWSKTAQWLSFGLVNTAVYWSPHIIVLGGSMMKKPGIDLAQVKKYFNSYLTIFPHKPRVVKAALGDIGGLYGGLALLKTIKR
jgi:predicted NBD/HSP70 family sugar kinase